MPSDNSEFKTVEKVTGYRPTVFFIDINEKEDAESHDCLLTEERNRYLLILSTNSSANSYPLFFNFYFFLKHFIGQLYLLNMAWHILRVVIQQALAFICTDGEGMEKQDKIKYVIRLIRGHRSPVKIFEL